MIQSEFDDTHLCIKCSCTIVGLENYIEHRKQNCSVPRGNHVVKIRTASPGVVETTQAASTTIHTTIITTAAQPNLDHTYDSFEFPGPEPEPPTTYGKDSAHGAKTPKSLGESYDLPYELCADVFFSSLQLQSVQSTGPSGSGKTIAAPPSALQREKCAQDAAEHGVVTWIGPSHATGSGEHNTETLMKAVSDLSGTKKPYESIFKPITFVDHESPDVSDDDEEEVGVEIDEDDEDYETIAPAHATVGKWKPDAPLICHSPPVVPVTHTGGKWKPDHVTHSQLTRLSSNWDEQPDEVDAGGQHHPPDDYTRGKWVPGTKLQRLEYKEEAELSQAPKQDYWCNICARKLKTKVNYENHLKTSYHRKRSEPEQQLEKANLDDLRQNFVDRSFELDEYKAEDALPAGDTKKRKRRTAFVKCELCRHYVFRRVLGKHLISHYHYRRMQMNPNHSLRMILDNIHAIVLQSPFQCRPCRYYFNTEEAFLQHWNSPEHLDASEGPGKFWCSYCCFECEDNNQMRRHLLGADHREVVFAINRSVPICISKKLEIDCAKCRQSFRYNLELREHMRDCHPGIENTGTASDLYQSRYTCELCGENLRSKIALHRHEKNKHFISKYFCSICKLTFNSPCKARRHRKTIEHKIHAANSERALTGTQMKAFQLKKSRSSRECSKCGFIASSEVEAMLHELSHQKTVISNDPAQPNPTVAAAPKRPKRKKKRPRSTRKDLNVPVKCKDCAEVLPSREELRVHRDTQHPLLRHGCMSCGQSFHTAQALGRHTRMCQPTAAKTATTQPPPIAGTGVITTKTWTCNECQFQAPYESELIFHRLHHTYRPLGKDQPIKCPLCTKVFRKDSLRCHLRLHTNEKIFECQICNLKFSRRHNLKDHINKLHHKETATTPPTATDLATTTATVTMITPAARKTTTTTDVSDSAADNKKQLAKQRTNIRAGDFPCFTCGKLFATKNNLKAHNVSHNENARKMNCSVEGCQYTGATNSHLRTHMATHSQLSFACSHTNCDYVGKSALHLRRHKRCHAAPTVVYKCDKCDFNARTKGHLERHLRTHTGEKPYKCPYCDFRCSTFDNIRKHILKTTKHPGKFIYECRLCEEQQQREGDDGQHVAVFKSNSYQDYQIHLTNVHPHAEMDR